MDHRAHLASWWASSDQHHGGLQIEAFLRYLSGSVLVAVVVPPVIETGPAAWLAVAVTLAAMLLTRKALLSLVLGMATAAACRAVIATL